MRAVASSEPCSVVNVSRLKSVSGTWRSRPTARLGKASGGGEDLEIGTHLSSRRTEGGTHGRTVASNQGRSQRQPRPSRRAKTRSITSQTGKSAGVVETGGSGRSSHDGRDNITQPEQRTRGLRWWFMTPEAGGADHAHREGKRAPERRRLYQTAHGMGECGLGA
jgi:hypothetical protein